MADINLKAAAEDTSLDTDALLFGADSQSASSPSVYKVSTLKTLLLGGGSLSVASGKTLTASNSLTLTGTDGSSVAFGAGGTVLYSDGALGTPSSGTLTNATGLPISTGVSGLGTGIATALAVNTGSAGAPVLFNGAGGTPSSLTLTNATGLPVGGISATGTPSGTTYLRGDGSWATPAGGGGTPGGSDTQIQYNNAGSFGGLSQLIYSGSKINVVSAPFGLSGNISSAAWTTSGIRYANAAATLTDTSSSGTVAAAYTDLFGGNTIAASNSTTFTDYATAFFGVPSAGTNVTLTNAWSIRLGGGLKFTTSALVNEASNTLALKNSTNAQIFRAYSTTASSGSYGYLAAGVTDAGVATADTLFIGTGGTGAALTKMAFAVNGTTQVSMASGGITAQNHLLFSADNTYDIGASGATRPRTGYFSGKVLSGTPTTAAINAATSTTGSLIVSNAVGATGIFESTAANSSGSGGGVLLYQNSGSAAASGTRIGVFLFGGISSNSGTTYRNSVAVAGFASENWADGSAYGGRIEFATTANTTTTRTTRLIIGNSGVITLGATEASTVPALKPSSAVLQVRLGDDTAFTDISARGVIHNGVTYANLPGTPTAGTVAYVTDASNAGAAWGDSVTAGGSTNKYLVWYNGTNWTVAGK